MVNQEFPFDKAEEYILRKGTMHLGTVEKLSFNSAEECVENILTTQRFHKSFRDVDNTIVCYEDYWRRSISDLFRLCKHYSPDITLKQVYESLIALIAKEEIYSWICHSLHKRVYGKSKTVFSNNTGLSSFPQDEFGFDFSKENIPFSFSGYGDKQKTSKDLNIEIYGSND